MQLMSVLLGTAHDQIISELTKKNRSTTFFRFAGRVGIDRCDVDPRMTDKVAVVDAGQSIEHQVPVAIFDPVAQGLGIVRLTDTRIEDDATRR